MPLPHANGHLTKQAGLTTLSSACELGHFMDFYLPIAEMSANIFIFLGMVQRLASYRACSVSAAASS